MLGRGGRLLAAAVLLLAAPTPAIIVSPPPFRPEERGWDAIGVGQVVEVRQRGRGLDAAFRYVVHFTRWPVHGRDAPPFVVLESTPSLYPADRYARGDQLLGYYEWDPTWHRYWHHVVPVQNVAPTDAALITQNANGRDMAQRRRRFYMVNSQWQYDQREALAYENPAKWFELSDVPDDSKDDYFQIVDFELDPAGHLSRCVPGHGTDLAFERLMCRRLATRGRFVPPRHPAERSGSLWLVESRSLLREWQTRDPRPGQN